jgi:hypothetical protein
MDEEIELPEDYDDVIECAFPHLLDAVEAGDSLDALKDLADDIIDDWELDDPHLQAGVWNSLAEALGHEDRHEDALDVSRTGLSLMADRPEDVAIAQALHARRLVLGGEAAEGQQVFADTLKRYPTEPSTFHIEGELWEELGNIERARDRFERGRALAIETEQPEGFIELFDSSLARVNEAANASS